MRHVTHNYIDGEFRPIEGGQTAPLFDPASEEQIGTVALSGASEVDAAVAAALRAFPAMARTSVEARVAMLGNLAQAMAAAGDRIAAAMKAEYGAPGAFVDFAANHAGSVFRDAIEVLQTFAWTRTAGNARVIMRPVGVVGAIIPWNNAAGFICSKLAAAIAAGTTIVIKPSELSGLQTQAVLEALHEAGLPRGVVNVVHGTGPVAGAALAAHPGIAKISFTGSTATGRAVLEAAAPTFKRVTLELGGKGAQIILPDAALDEAIPLVLRNGLMNSGQACIAGTRILAPAAHLEDVAERLVAAIAGWKPGPSHDPAAQVGPMVSRAQWERVQDYIRLGIAEGARVLAGGAGRPDELPRGWFVRPTLFGAVNNSMRIAREEIFGPVLCLLPYADEDEAVRIANDTPYGLQNYVLGGDPARAAAVAERLESGRVAVNAAFHDPLAPFGGFKQSGIGREYGAFGLEALLEPQAIIA